MGREKISLPLDKKQWQPSPLPGQIVLVSSLDRKKTPNVAPKSWVTMVSFDGPRLAFGCNVNHTTFRNIVATREFVVNIPDLSLVERIWGLLDFKGPERLRRSGLHMQSGQSVEAPLIEECSAHLECAHQQTIEFGEEVLIVGLIQAVLLDVKAAELAPEDQYFRLRPVFFLEEGAYGSMDGVLQIGRLPPANHLLFLVEIEALPGGDTTLLGRHLEHLGSLRSQGRLYIAGSFEPTSVSGRGADGPSEAIEAGLYILGASSLDEALALAASDPLAAAGSNYTVRPWRRSF